MRNLTEIVEEFIKNNDENLNTEEQVMISEMATIGWFQETKPSGKPTGMEFKVFVNGDEGRIPHMHIWDEATNGKQFHSCIMLEKPQYFNHGYKNSKLSKKQIKALIDFLYDTDDDGILNWRNTLREWNKASKTQKQVDKAMSMPDYTKLI